MITLLNFARELYWTVMELQHDMRCIDRCVNDPFEHEPAIRPTEERDGWDAVCDYFISMHADLADDIPY